jgi:putative ATP-dependent endonuclease of the OLD family
MGWHVGLHLSRIEIRNLRNFQDFRLDSFPSPAVIVGENGVGKSNFLEALRLVLDPSLPDSRRQLQAEDVWEGHPKGLGGGVVVTVQVELQGYDDDADAKGILDGCTVSRSPYTARLTYRFYPRSSGPESAGAGTGNGEGESRALTPQDYEFIVFGGENEADDIRSIRRDIALRVLPALRDAEHDLQSARRNPLRDLLELLPMDPANLEATAAIVASAMDQLAEDPSVSELEERLSTRLREMLGSRFLFEPTLGFTSSRPDELVRAVRLYLDVARRRGVAESSLGSANVIYLGLLLEVLASQRQADQFVATLVAVEEPEAHLHVALQRRLFHYLLRRESTLVLTTHSPHIAAVTPIGSFVVLRRTEEGTVGHTTSSLPVTEQQAEDLERYIDVSRAEALFATAVILVEGIAELYLLPSLAAAANFDLDDHGIAVASAHGTDFGPYHALLGPDGLSTPLFIVTDGDAAPDRRGRVEAGLKRGAKLLPTAERMSLKAQIDSLPAQSDPHYDNQRGAISGELEQSGIFVGRQTLEVDRCRTYSAEMEQAFEELSTSSAARRDVAAGIVNELDSVPDTDARTDMLTRISDLGKGRYAQRLASHVARVDLPGRLAECVGVCADEGLPADTYERLTAGYIFRALNAVSVAVRGEPLLPLQDAGPVGDGEEST